jgi:uncharacterized RDD family membrane protein YckC
MDQSTESSDAPAKKEIKVIGFGRRLTATIIDGILVIFGTTILAFAASMLFAFVSIFNQNDPLPFNTLLVVVGLLFSFFYYTGFWVKSGQTVGNSMMSIMVVGTDGEPISWGQGFLRYIGYIVSGVVASIGFLWIEFNSTRQGWHDKIATTYVVGENEAFSDANAVEFVPSDPGKPWVWIVVWIVVALAAPTGLFSSLWFLGPIINRMAGNLLWGILGG